MNTTTADALSTRGGAPSAPAQYEAKPLEKLAPSRQLKLAITRILVIAASIFTIRYFWWRFFHTMNPAAMLFFDTLLADKALSVLTRALFYFVKWNASPYGRPEPLHG